VTVDPGVLFPTTGPEQRFNTVLFVEKEGFGPLFAAEQLAEKHDLAIMSTKGMSVTASRMLIDNLCYRGLERILALHDFDVSGFSIFGTLGTSNRRYEFINDVPVVDIGLRLDDVEAMALESEPTDVWGDWDKRVQTLRRHGATEEEIAFLKNERVELNAMTSRQILDFVEAKLEERGVEKLVPEDTVLEQHARWLIERHLAAGAIEKIKSRIAKQAANTSLPADLLQRIADQLDECPELSWDAALAMAIDIKGVVVPPRKAGDGRQPPLPGLDDA
jgi:hypothetical protein